MNPWHMLQKFAAEDITLLSTPEFGVYGAELPGNLILGLALGAISIPNMEASHNKRPLGTLRKMGL